MQIDQAYTHLDLPLDATEEEIKSAYRRLSKKAHPDLSSGDKETQRILNEARDTALAYTKIRGAVTPISPASLSHKIQSAIATYNREPANETARSLFRRRMNPMNAMKWASWIVGATAGVAALAGSNIGLFQGDEQTTKELKTIFELGAFTFGLMGFVLQFFIKSMEWRLERFLSRISDKVECARQLAENLEHSDRESVSEEDLPRYEFRSEGSFPSPFDIDYSLILLQKAVEHNLLIPLEADEITPDFKQKYSVNFKPSLFKPPPPMPPKPRTASEIRSDLRLFFSMTAFCGMISLGLVAWGLGWWAILPGVPTVIGVLGSAGNAMELVKRQHPDKALYGLLQHWFKQRHPK